MDVADTYRDTCKKILEKTSPSEKDIDMMMLYAKNMIVNLNKALETVRKQQKPDIIPEEVKKENGGHSTYPPVPELKSGRAGICLNGEWYFSVQGSPDKPPQSWNKERVPHKTFTAIGIPNIIPELGPQWNDSDHDAWYKVEFQVPPEWRDKRIKVEFGAVFHYTEVFVNGEYCGSNMGGFNEFEIDVTKAVKPGFKNTMLVYIQDTSVTQTGKNNELRIGLCAPVSGPNLYPISDMWGYNLGGIWQDVYLKAYPKVYVSDTFIATSVREKKITAKVWIKNEDALTHEVSIGNKVKKDGRVVLPLPGKTVTIKPGEVKMLELSENWPDPQPWGIGGEYGEPALYFLETVLKYKDGIDRKYTRFGFREFWIEGRKFILNGKEIILQGGGAWYLREAKSYRANRWWVSHYYKIERGANVNFERFHLNGDVLPDWLDAADEMGMLCEVESPFWGVSPPVDIYDQFNFDDPVWVKNTEDYYRRLVRKHRNHPSVVIWSMENETFTGKMPREVQDKLLNRFVEFGKVVKETDFTRPLHYHGSREVIDDPRLEIGSVHYKYGKELQDYLDKAGNKPVVAGEFGNYNSLADKAMPKNTQISEDGKSIKDSELMGKRLQEYADWFKSEIISERNMGVAGIIPFCPIDGLQAPDKKEHLGPWADELYKSYFIAGPTPTQAKPHAYIPIEWPSLSGPGIKGRYLLSNNRGRGSINWFDPNRPVCTLNKLYYAIRDAFLPMPPVNAKRLPEVIITVKKGGNALPGVNVFLAPQENQYANPIGIMTDKDGTAWFVLKEPGKYKVYCESDENSKIIEVPEGKTIDKPGYDYIQRIELNISVD